MEITPRMKASAAVARKSAAEGMVLLKNCKVFSYIAVCVAGGVLHNMGQIGMACLLMGTTVLKYYIPFLVLSGTLAGIVIGILAAIMVKRVDLPQ